jgi:hypothetical protein
MGTVVYRQLDEIALTAMTATWQPVRLTDLYRHGPRGGIFDFRQQAVETALGRSFRA